MQNSLNVEYLTDIHLMLFWNMCSWRVHCCLSNCRTPIEFDIKSTKETMKQVNDRIVFQHDFGFSLHIVKIVWKCISKFRFPLKDSCHWWWYSKQVYRVNIFKLFSLFFTYPVPLISRKKSMAYKLPSLTNNINKIWEQRLNFRQKTVPEYLYFIWYDIWPNVKWLA